jgi:GSH-dependent disulfide-bond oxidoreductase
MFEVHAFATPNSVKVPIALEEMGLNYQLVPVNLRRGGQKNRCVQGDEPQREGPAPHRPLPSRKYQCGA